MDTDPDLRYHFIHEKLKAKGLDDNIAVALAAETALAHSRLPHWSARWWSMTTFAWRNVSKRSKQWSRLLQSPSRKGSAQNDVESSLPVRPMFSRPTWTLKHPQKGRRKQKPPPEPPKSVGALPQERSTNFTSMVAELASGNEWSGKAREHRADLKCQQNTSFCQKLMATNS